MAIRGWTMPLAAAAVLLGGAAHAQTAPRADTPPIRADALRGHMELLASDALEGREAGTRGYDVAALYVAARFRELGLGEAGTDGYFQPVPLRQAVLVPGSVALTVSGPGGERRFTDADHVAAYPSDREAEQRITAPAVFAGYGIVAPEYGRDDYAELDVRGKWVVLLGGPPPWFPSEVAAHLGSTGEQRARAVARGAVGILFIYTPAFQARFPFDRLDEVVREPTLDWFDPAARGADTAVLRAFAFTDPTASAALFAGARRGFDEVMLEAATRAPAGFPLAVTATLERRSTLQRLSSANVAALLPGGDPRLAEEIVAVVGHLDHVGVGAPKGGDSIYNGALDNASGIAMILEMARVLSAPGQRPRRSVLFVAMTAEEKGLVGSDYFARHPSVGRGRIVGVVNLDGAMPMYEFTDVVGYGAESSTLARSLERAAASMGLTVSPDPHPQLSMFTRSDHYSFVRQGVPAIFPQMGNGRAADGRSGNEINQEFAEKHLHEPSDDLSLPLDYAILARYAELLRRFTLEVANADERPLWYEGNIFGDRFAPDARRAPRPRQP
jgi:hypothetical protein